MEYARETVLSVVQLNEYVRRSLAADPMLRGVKLRGEISNFKWHTSGHLYFSLKDEEARIACVMFRQYTFGMSVRPRDGMRVVLTGSVSLFTRDGSYQFYAEHLREDGVGDLFLRFEQLKRKLEAEGLFDPARKKPLPLLPRTVGVATSPTGAAIRDIITVSCRRNPRAHILLCPVKVQGDGAAEDIARGIETLARQPEVDVILIGRGGGSIEELWAFNEEIVARAIAACPVPVVSAVGHETDFTIADFAADLRAATPSAAAEHIVPRVDSLTQALDAQTQRMARATERRVALSKTKLHGALLALKAAAPDKALARQAARLAEAQHRLHAVVSRILAEHKAALLTAGAQLTALGPQAVLARGYAYLTAHDAIQPTPISSAKGLTIGQRIDIHLRDGSAIAAVEQVTEEA